MDRQEIHRRMIANWEKAGKPMCQYCRQPVMGRANIAEWKRNKGICPSCALSMQKVKDNTWRSVPPLGIRKE